MRQPTSLILILGCVSCSVVAEIPDMACEETKKLYIATGSFSAQEFDGDTLFRFEKSKLYLSSPSKEEYLYNDVSEQEYGRWISGHKTIIFKSEGRFKNGLIVHANETEVYISRIHCSNTR